MPRNSTVRFFILFVIAGWALSGQTIPSNPASGWRRVGNNVLDLGLASAAGGPVQRVWFSPDGQTLFARLPSGKAWGTTDLERWTSSEAAEAAPAESIDSALPEAAAKSAVSASLRARVYAAGQHVWRSDDGGRTWTNVTLFGGRSILGGPLVDIAVSPVNADEVLVAGMNGVWRSVDGGASWTGLNDGLPNLPARRLVEEGTDVQSLRISTSTESEFAWTAGERSGWRPVEPALATREEALRAIASRGVSAEVTAAARVQDQFYAASADGRLFSSADRGRTWRPQSAPAGSGRVLRFHVDSRDPLFALAITNSRQRARVLRTLNGGILWDDITGSLPAAPVNGISADRLTGAVYIATGIGVFMTYTDTVAASPPTPWSQVREGGAWDVMVDSAGNQIYVLSDGGGVFAALAPHRSRDPRVVSAGDRVLRAAAPGSLLSVIGARVQSARVGEMAAPVLDAGETESQVQLPFDLNGNGLMISMDSSAGRLQLGLPVSPTSPSIFVDRDGNPLLLNGETGLMLDAATPARSNGRIQILASGLGRVTPVWPAGLAAPLQDPPRVLAPVRVFLDREPLEVLRATLAPGYVGLYLVEAQMPSVVNRGTSELFLDAGEGTSNRVRIFVEP